MQTKDESVSAIILAAGLGTRMKSDLPKVLHEVCGKAIVSHVIDAVKKAGVGQVGLVLSGDLSRFSSLLEHYQDTSVCIQNNRLGTGDAVASTAAFYENVRIPHYADFSLYRGKKVVSSHVLICAGDTPALDPAILRDFIESHISLGVSVSVLGMEVDDPTGYGRLVYDDQGSLEGIVEQKDASDLQKKIKVCNSGVMIAKTTDLFEYLDELKPNNAQKEYYLTDIIALARARSNTGVSGFITPNWQSFMGVNTPEQKAVVADYMASRTLAEN